VPIDLATQLQRLAASLRTGGAGVQHRAAVTQPGHAVAVEQVGIDARDLRGGIGADAQCATGELVDELERAQVQRTPGAGQQ